MITGSARKCMRMHNSDASSPCRMLVSTPQSLNANHLEMETQTIINSLSGGLLIGIAASLLLWLNGRIAGISSIIVNLLFSKNRLWPILFALGIIGGAALYYALGGSAPTPRAHFPVWLLVLGGLCVGFGTALAHGCTSGHGVCGLGRLSLRSLIATLTFLTVGLLTTYIVRHVCGVL